MSVCDLAIVGSGPAGMAAAVEAARHGLDVVVLDEQAEPGGQIWRAIERVRAERPGDLAVLGGSYAEGLALVDAFRASGVDYRPGSSVWRIDAGEPESGGPVRLAYSRDGLAATLQARRLLIAAGALERPVPIPGWTLPGVLSAGGAQSVLKAAGMVPAGRVVIAGAGPLLLLVASQLHAAGADIAAVVTTSGWPERLAALPFLPGAWPARREIAQGLGWRRELARAGIPFFEMASELAVTGRGQVDGFTFTHARRRLAIAADIVLLHDGVVPQTQITRQAGCAQEWHAAQRCWQPQTDAWGASDLPGILVAGDAAGIAGARAAVQSGRLAGLAAAVALGRLDREACAAAAAPIRATLDGARSVRPLLDALFPPGPQAAHPADEALVCRCEAVPAAELRKAVGLGAVGPNQAKAFVRCGMGACQGRLCALTVAEVIAAGRGRAVEDVGVYRVRPPIKPVTLGELAAIVGSDPSMP